MEQCCKTCRHWKDEGGGAYQMVPGPTVGAYVKRLSGLCNWPVPKTPDSVPVYIPGPEDRPRMYQDEGKECLCYLPVASANTEAVPSSDPVETGGFRGRGIL